MGETSIEWTDQTWNPTRGCTRISPGCVNCYAERMAARDLPGMKSPTTGEPFAIITPSGPRWTGNVELIPHMLDVPLKRRKPTVYFVNSMSDLFHESMPFREIDRVFTAMVAADHHTYQILTKRADRMRAYFASGRHDDGHGPDRADYHLDQNIWLGVSVENQEYADKRIPDLMATPAAVRFVSYEPALGPVDFRPYLNCTCDGTGEHCAVCISGGLDQIIIGGESGPGARPFDIQWARNTIAQCKAAGVAAFVKQIGAKPFSGHSLHKQIHHRSTDGNLYLKLEDRKGGNMEEWPVDLRVRQMPEVRV